MQKAELGRIMVPGQPSQKHVCETLSQQKKTGLHVSSQRQQEVQNRKITVQVGLGKSEALSLK
jgi:molybdopterin-guanine dinucleotide biosynthesis protein A